MGKKPLCKYKTTYWPLSLTSVSSREFVTYSFLVLSIDLRAYKNQPLDIQQNETCFQRFVVKFFSPC